MPATHPLAPSAEYLADPTVAAVLVEAGDRLRAARDIDPEHAARFDECIAQLANPAEELTVDDIAIMRALIGPMDGASSAAVALRFFQPDDRLDRTNRYALVGPAGAVEIATCRTGGPTWLIHDAIDRYGAGADAACNCDLLPATKCWPDTGTVYSGPRLDAYLAGDPTAIEAILRGVYAKNYGAEAR